MNAAEVLDQVFDVYKRSFFKQLAVSIIFSIIFFIVLYILLIIGLIAGFFVIFATIAETTAGLSVGAVIAIALFILLFMLGITIYQALISTGNALVTKQTFLGEHCDVGKVIKSAFKKIWVSTSAALANLILLVPVVIAIAAFTVVYITMIIAIDELGGLGVTAIVIMSILLVLLIFAFLIVYSTITMMSMSVAIFEGKWFFSAFKRGFALIKPDFMKLMGIVTVWFVIIMVLSYSFEIFFGIGTALGMYFLPQEVAAIMYMSTIWLSYLISIGISVLIAPLSGIFYTIAYINQRIKHEGLDIELNLNALRR